MFYAYGPWSRKQPFLSKTNLFSDRFRFMFRFETWVTYVSHVSKTRFCSRWKKQQNNYVIHEHVPDSSKRNAPLVVYTLYSVLLILIFFYIKPDCRMNLSCNCVIWVLIDRSNTLKCYLIIVCFDNICCRYIYSILH
jgi:hypothetical protein